MQKVQKLLGVTMLAALLGTGGTASAADLYSGGGLKDVPVYYPPTWTGFYTGAHAGAAWTSLDNTGPITFTDPSGMTTTLGGQKFDSRNAIAGGQFGYNWQSGAWVFGLEVDLGAFILSGRNNVLGMTRTPAGAMSSIVSLDMKDDGARFAGDFDGRIGYAWGNWLIYAKGGFAFFETNFALRENVMTATTATTTVFDGNNSNDFLTGWNVGGGLEWKVSPSWSIKTEYLHFDFNNLDMNCCGDGINAFNRNKRDLTSDTWKLGFNYFWNPPVQPLK